MSRSMQGLIELNGLFLVTGLAIIWGLRGWRSWLDLLDTLGVAFMFGLSTICVASTVALVVGGGLSYTIVLGLCAGVVAVFSAVPRGTPAAAVRTPPPLTSERLQPDRGAGAIAC